MGSNVPDKSRNNNPSNFLVFRFYQVVVQRNDYETQEKFYSEFELSFTVC